MRAKILFILLLSVAAGRMTCAAEPSDSTKTETSRKNIISRIIEYFSESNRSYPTKKFDFSIIGGPHYSSDSKFGIGILGAGLYRSSANDTLTPVSQVYIYRPDNRSPFQGGHMRHPHIPRRRKASHI